MSAPEHAEPEPTGLTAAEVEASRAAHGSNQLTEIEGEPFLGMLKDALADRTLQILMGAAVLVLLVDLYQGGAYFFSRGHYVEGTAILAAVAIAAIVTVYNDWRAQSEFKSLQVAGENQDVRVLREGAVKRLSAFDLVVGDLVEVEAGDRVPADGVVLRGFSLAVDESMLTGESGGVPRDPGDDVRAGTLVVEGRGLVRLTAVGETTEYGRLRAQLAVARDPTPLQERLGTLADRIGMVGLSAAILIFTALFLASLYWGQLTLDAAGLRTVLSHVVVAVTIVVVAVPEGLPVAVTISLAYSVMAMARDRSLVRRLVACETMGGADVLCVDKTGTLTWNRMTAERIWFHGHGDDAVPEAPPDWLRLGFSEIAALASTAHLGADGAAIGSPTEAALLAVVESWGEDVEALRRGHPITHSFGFTSDRKRMSVVTGDRALVKGAPEALLPLCTGVLGPDGVQPLDDETRATLAARLDGWAGESLRTLALARREVTDAPDADSVEQALVLVALVGLGDPVRPGVPESLARCRTAGVEIKMVTGDARLTAEAIAHKVGMVGPGDEVLDGPTFRALSDDELDRRLPRLRVLARAVPSDKLRLVERLRIAGRVVGVTGDGTNDGPALRRADVGLSMGLSGTDVAREASDIVILDDDFTSVVRAIRWGRAIFRNIRKFLQFQLTVSVVALATAFLAAATGLGTPLTVVQLLWVNLVMDTLAALALAIEPPSDALLDERPHGREEPLVSADMWANILGMSAVMLGVLLTLLHTDWLVARADPTHTTMVFHAFVMMQIGNLFNCRATGFSGSIWADLGQSRTFLAVAALIVVVQVGIVQFGGGFFGTQPIGWSGWALSIALGAAMLPVGAALRAAGRRLPAGWPRAFEGLAEQAGRLRDRAGRWLDQPAAGDPLELIGGAGALAVVVGIALRTLGAGWAPTGFALFAAGLTAMGCAAWERRGRLARHDPRSQRLHAIASVLLAAVLLVQANAVSARHHTRFDLTAERRFSLSAQTTGLLASLPQPLRLTSVFRPGRTATEVADLLSAYATAGHFVEVHHIDPDRDPGEVERLADRIGLKAPSLASVVVEYQGRTRVVSAEDMLERQYTYKDGKRFRVPNAPPMFRGEQALTSALVAITAEDPPRICFAVGHGEREPEDFGAEGVALLRDRLRRQGYLTATLRLLDSTRIPASCSVLVQAGPRREIDGRVRGALEQYVRGGGKWLLTVEPWAAGGLEPMLADWGIEVRPMYVADPGERIAGAGPTTLVASAFQPHPITGSMTGLSVVLPYATAVRTQPPKHTVVGANLVLTTKGGIGETDRRSREPRYDEGKDRRGELSVAAAVEEPPHALSVEGRRDPARIVVIGDTDFLTNAHLHRLGNTDFALNALDWLASRESLIEVRARAEDDRRITLSGSAQNALFWLAIGVVPGLVALLGGLVAFRRRS